MFEIGFWELVMVGVVALLVVGPAQLPELARTAGRWVGKARYFVHKVTTEINREIKAEELKNILEEQARISEMDNLITETREHFTSARDALRITYNHNGTANPNSASESEQNPNESQ